MFFQKFLPLLLFLFCLMFLVIVGLHMFVRNARQAALFVIIGYAGFLVLSLNIGRLLGSRLHALTSGDLRDRIFDLANRAGVKLRQVYVLPETSAQLSNAFARSDNSVMITNSLIKNLSRREVDGIMAHEIGHLQAKHLQSSGRIMTKAIVVANLAGTLSTSLHTLRMPFRSSSRVRWASLISSRSFARVATSDRRMQSVSV